MFKNKCPSCGAKNDKERMSCIECGYIFEMAGVEQPLVPTTANVELTEPTKSGTELKPTSRIKRKGWFWTGVVFLVAGIANWGTAGSSVINGNAGGAISFFVGAAILTTIGINCIRRGLRPKAP
jgi:hypothetical protein